MSTPATDITFLTPGSLRAFAETSSIICKARLLEAASGRFTATALMPWSSLGTKPVGVCLAITPVKITTTAKQVSTSLDLRMQTSTLETYLPRVLSNQLLKAATALPIKPLGASSSLFFFKIKEHSAGVKDSATIADSIMDTDTVIANCLYNSPTVPPVKATGINTADRTKAIATTGPDTSFIAR